MPAPLSLSQWDLLTADVRSVLPHLNPSALQGQRLFVTGGTGFFGLWLLTALHELNAQGAGIDVCVLSRDPAAFRAKHPALAASGWLRFVQGNVRDVQLPGERFDLLLHAATETSAQAHARPIQMLDDILLGTRRVMDLAVSSGARRMLLVSSGAVYGPQPAHISHQPDDAQLACNPLLPSSSYGEGKRVMELMGAITQASHGIDSIVARCYAFAGPGLPLDGHFAIGNFVRDALEADAIRVNGDGSPIRSYLYGADLAVWLLKLLAQGQAGQSYNVGSDDGLSIADLAHRVRDELAPSKPVLIQRVQSQGEQQRNVYVPSIQRARDHLDLAPWTPLPDMIQRMACHAKS